MKREYGGYIELDTYSGAEYHENAIALNCGRNCLGYLIEKSGIKKIDIPYFCCNSVSATCIKSAVEIEYYHIDDNFKPIFDKSLSENEWLYIVNYYGQLTNSEIEHYKKKFGRIIVDNAQAFFQKPVNEVDTLYTCRKFFGVADGAYLYTKPCDTPPEPDCSFERMHFLLGRYEKGANEFYKEYVDNNRLFRDEPIKAMSKLTHNLLRAIDYSSFAEIRRRNFEYLSNEFSKINRLKLITPHGAYMYPLYLEFGAAARKTLQSKSIYIPTLWPDVFELCEPNTLEHDYAENILPLPVDQRYSEKDMEYIISEVKKCIH